MQNFDITNLIQAKSDQLNADDLISAPRRIKVTGTSKGNAENPVVINYEGDCGRPFKPCLTVRRIIAHAWGVMTGEWVGKEMLLYCDPTVVYGGKEVGGIRISAISNIEKRIVVSLAKTRGKKVQHTIEVLTIEQKPPYDAAKFDSVFDAMAKKINDGSMTHEQVINKCESTGSLTDEQKKRVRDIGKDSDIEIDEEESESVSDFFNDTEKAS